MTIPTLDDDRIDTMRRSVMHRVDQDVRRRGRRLRRTAGLAAASVLVVGIGGYTVSSIDRPGGVGVSDSGGGAGSSDSAGSSADQPMPESGELANGRTVPDADRQVVTTGSVEVSVSRPRQVTQLLSAWVETIGGRVDDRSETGSGDDATADLTIRVPSDQVTATVDQLGRYGTVEDVSVQNVDVTAAAKDLDARIDALQLSIERLERILAEAGSSGDVIKAEKALTQRQEQLESLQAQRKATADQVSLSTLSISLTQTARADTVEPGGFGGGLRGGWNALVSTINVVVEVAGRLLPWAVVAMVLLGTGRLVRNRTLRRSPSN